MCAKLLFYMCLLYRLSLTWTYGELYVCYMQVRYSLPTDRLITWIHDISKRNIYPILLHNILQNRDIGEMIDIKFISEYSQKNGWHSLIFWLLFMIFEYNQQSDSFYNLIFDLDSFNSKTNIFTNCLKMLTFFISAATYACRYEWICDEY